MQDEAKNQIKLKSIRVFAMPKGAQGDNSGLSCLI